MFNYMESASFLRVYSYTNEVGLLTSNVLNHFAQYGEWVSVEGVR